MGVGAAEISTCTARAADPRVRRRLLDRVLDELEAASERGSATVSPMLAEQTSGLVSALAPGMSIRDAIGLVFKEQSACLRPATPRSIPSVLPPSCDPCSTAAP